jgi:hypothetical protein
MNRDEKLTRPTGLPPRKRMVNGREVLSPSEPGGGTWIALNDTGVCMALINWYSAPARVNRNAISRGDVVKSVMATDSADAADAELRGAPLGRINPFRLIGIFPRTHEIFEWRWDVKRLVSKKLTWKTRQWISSGFDEPTAQCVRGRIFRSLLRECLAGGLGWLRQLHRCHSPQSGPFSTCMHRTDAATVSYIEITVSDSRAKMGYHAGPPCSSPTSAIENGTEQPILRPYMIALALVRRNGPCARKPNNKNCGLSLDTRPHRGGGKM